MSKLRLTGVLVGWSKALLAAVVAQAVYWLVLDPVAFSPALPGTMIEAKSAEFAEISKPTVEAATKANFKNVELPFEHCCEPGYFVARVKFDLEDVPQAGLGLGPRLDVENFMIVMNGSIVHNPGRMEAPRQTFHGMNKRPIHIPSSSLKAGENIVDVVMTNTAIPMFGFRGVSLGEYHAFVADGRHRTFMIYEYRTLGGIIAGIIALLALVLLLRSEQREFAFWLLVLAAAWSVLNLHYSWYDWPFGASALVLLRFALLNLLPLAWLNLVDCWTGHGFRWFRWLLSGIYVVAMAIWTSLLTKNSVGWYLPSIEFLEWWAWVLGGASIARVLWHLANRREDRYWELALLILCLTAMIVDTFDDASFHVSNSAPILFVALALAFFARNIRLFQSVHDINAMLAGQLRERESEIAEQYERQEELARRETLVSERQRLMRDMHDGIGGQLMSLLFAARQKKIAQPDLVQSLQSLIDELRLIIDSLDTVGGSLGSALATFRTRIEPRLNAAGVKLDWTNSVPNDLDALGSHEVLQIFRIVQEAVTNAIKHSGSDTINVDVALDAVDTNLLRLRVADNGHGLNPRDADTKGHGLENMQARASSIGGELSLTSERDGTTVALAVPLVRQASPNH